MLGHDERQHRGVLRRHRGHFGFADFIHIEESRAVPLLSLIHVKGSKSASPDRRISTSAYEVVVGQAIKNVRFLDLGNMATQLEAGKNKEVAQANWLDSVKQARRRRQSWRPSKGEGT